MTSPTLDALVAAGTLAGYQYEKVYQVPGEERCTRVCVVVWLAVFVVSVCLHGLCTPLVVKGTK